MKKQTYRILFEEQTQDLTEERQRMSEIGLGDSASRWTPSPYPSGIGQMGSIPDGAFEGYPLPPTESMPYPGLSQEKVEGWIDSKLAALKVYVVESEITQAQNRVKSIVELSSF